MEAGPGMVGFGVLGSACVCAGFYARGNQYHLWVRTSRPTVLPVVVLGSGEVRARDRACKLTIFL